MIDTLLGIFDKEGGYKGVIMKGAHQKKGRKGLNYGVKAMVLFAMKIIQVIWLVNGKYAI